MQTKIKSFPGSITTLFSLLLFVAGCEKKLDNHTTNTTNGTVTDIDGNIYNTVTIGTQVWMTSNLKTTRLNDGTTIPHVTDATNWSYLSTPALCDYDNLPVNASTYGKLYNWYAVNTGLLAPVGWHVPTDAEWLALENYLGNDDVMGGKLKETGSAHWQLPNTAATNETGFTALPGGSRYSTGSFYSLTYDGYFWTSTTGTDISYAYYHWVDFNLGSVYRTEDYKTDGISVRCVKD
ncbi:MAG: fibrobacter succinogenes major paralogous domain-containing protein [Ferruginibacter sp.]